MERVKIRSIARSIVLALCCSLVSAPVWAKTFVGVLYPFLGPMAAIGLVDLANELKAMPDVEVATYLHQSWRSLVDDINRQPKGTRILIVGYSLGANNAILVANNVSYVDSIVALQPSMLTSKDSLTGSVGKVIEIYNPNPWMTFGGMGSQKLEAPNIEYVVNNDTHPGAQFSTEFRNIVRNEMARVAALDTVSAAKLKTAQTARPINPTKTASPAEKPTAPPSKLDLAKRERAQPQLPPQITAQAALPETVSSYANLQSGLVQRQLTIVDMTEYVKRAYATSPSASVSETRAARVGSGE
jgi:dienelactone hydrolase